MLDLSGVTAADFKLRYPVFKAVADSSVDAVLDEARGSVNATWIEADQKPALLALAAHLLVSSGGAGDGLSEDDMGALGMVTALRAGDHEVRFGGAGTASAASGGSAFGAYGSTPFGRRYLELAARSFPPIAIV